MRLALLAQQAIRDDLADGLYDGADPAEATLALVEPAPLEEIVDDTEQVADVIPMAPEYEQFVDLTNDPSFWDLDTRPMGKAWPHVAMLGGAWGTVFALVSDEVRHLCPDRSERDVQLIALFVEWSVTLALWQVFDRWMDTRRDDAS